MDIEHVALDHVNKKLTDSLGRNRESYTLAPLSPYPMRVKISCMLVIEMNAFNYQKAHVEITRLGEEENWESIPSERTIIRWASHVAPDINKRILVPLSLTRMHKILTDAEVSDADFLKAYQICHEQAHGKPMQRHQIDNQSSGLNYDDVMDSARHKLIKEILPNGEFRSQEELMKDLEG